MPVFLGHAVGGLVFAVLALTVFNDEFFRPGNYLFVVVGGFFSLNGTRIAWGGRSTRVELADEGVRYRRGRLTRGVVPWATITAFHAVGGTLVVDRPGRALKLPLDPASAEAAVVAGNIALARTRI